MKFIKRHPSPKLLPYIRHYWLLEIDVADAPFQQLFFPFGFHELIFNLGSVPGMQYLNSNTSFAQPSGFYAGQFTRPFHLHYDEPCRCIGISMQPWAGSLLFDEPSDSFTNQVQDIKHFNDFNELSDRILPLEDYEQLFICMDEFFWKLVSHKIADVVSIEIATQLINKPIRKNINSTLECFGLSKRRIEQRFLENTGLSIGAFTRKVRFQKAAGMLRSGIYSENLTSVGLEAGYYDQSHFISDFKEFSGTTPRNFVRQQSDVKEFLRSLLIS